MTEPVIIGRAQLWLGDCRDILPLLPKVDAVVTDPPYDLHEKGPGASHLISLSKFNGAAYNSMISGFDVKAVFDALERLCDPFNLFCFCSNKQISQIMAYHEDKGRSTTLLVWHKLNAPPFAHRVWRGDIEYCIHAKASGAVFQGSATDKKRVSSYSYVRDEAHPAVKPLPLMKKFVGICSNEEQTILDPFMGVGTTGSAAIQMSRDFIGIEREAKYFDIACKRIEDAQRQGDFFVEQAA